MPRDFTQVDWSPALVDDCRQLIRLAVREDLDRWNDLTTLALVPPEARARAVVVARAPGLIAGLRVAELVLDEMDIDHEWRPLVNDGDAVAAGTHVAEVSAAARHLLTAERTLLNFLQRLSGIATNTARYVAAVAGTGARVYDTRKTTPGWRRLEKYAVRLGGGYNHRTGLYDAVLIKDNHLAQGAAASGAAHFSPAEAVLQARQFLAELPVGVTSEATLLEVEVDTLEQLREVLAAKPDIVLLDNMSPEKLREAVLIRNGLAPAVELEASGGITLATIRSVAETGVERISCGSLTYAAPALDIALDWL